MCQMRAPRTSPRPGLGNRRRLDARAPQAAAYASVVLPPAQGQPSPSLRTARRLAPGWTSSEGVYRAPDTVVIGGCAATCYRPPYLASAATAWSASRPTTGPDGAVLRPPPSGNRGPLIVAARQHVNTAASIPSRDPTALEGTPRLAPRRGAFGLWSPLAGTAPPMTRGAATRVRRCAYGLTSSTTAVSSRCSTRRSSGACRGRLVLIALTARELGSARQRAAPEIRAVRRTLAWS